ncbi:hypothetical protein HGRIS_014482 [Hohenbuehelia grisea]|uniref:SET domain-containing protein n=1 Tax=Hohenbuehelia grisea TaxID=104357 RepID=A0ABR3JVR2_9AGAR
MSISEQRRIYKQHRAVYLTIPKNSAIEPRQRVMKRGFLTAAKGKKALSKATAPNAVSQSVPDPRPDHSGTKKTQTEDVLPEFLRDYNPKLSIGKVEQTGLPDGYVPWLPEVKQDDSDNPSRFRDDDLVITTQPYTAIGAKFADVPGGFTKCLLSGHARRLILRAPGFPRPPPQPKNGLPFRVMEIPGKGLGVVATQDLKAGDLILSERPILVAGSSSALLNPPMQKLSGLTHEQIRQVLLYEMEKLLEQLFAQLPEEQQKAYMALHNCHLEDGSGPLMGIKRTNGFNLTGLCDQGDKATYAGVFDTLSRLNHSCNVNAKRKWDMSSFSMTLKAFRPIPAGTEIVISYISDTHLLTSERQAQLAPYGFTCTCPTCSDPAASDAVRAKLSSMNVKAEPLIAAWAHDRTLPDDHLLKPALANLALLERECLEYHGAYMSTLFLVMRAYVVLGNVKEVARYGAIIVDTQQAVWGPGKALDAFRVFAKPGAFMGDPLWGVRKKI